MSQQPRKRKKKASPNESILSFLRELKQDEEGSSLSYAVGKAIRSIETEQLEIKTHEDLRKIKYVGGYLANQIMAHLQNSENPDLSEDAEESEAIMQSNSNNKRKKSYEPALRSAAFALLIALLDAEKEGLTFLDKAGLGRRAQTYANEPILPKKSGNSRGNNYSYNGWSSMNSTLIKKHLVTKVSKPARFSLTEEGRKLAKICAEKNASASNKTAEVYNPEGTGGTDGTSSNAAEHEGQNPLLSVTDTPPAKRPKSTESSFVMLATTVVLDLQAAGHDRDKLQSSMNAALSSWNPPSTPTGLRLAILHNMDSASVGNSSSRNSSGGDSHVPAPDDEGAAELEHDDNMRPSISHRRRTIARASNGAESNVFLYLDVREKLGRKAAQNAQKFAEEIKAEGVPTEIRTLPVGDALFVRRCPHTGSETLLNFVAERKIASDFSSSVSDRRIFRQVYSLQNCRLSRTTVVIEGGFGGNVDEKHLERLEKTIGEINSFHGIYVKRTRNTKETIAFYRSIYRHLCSQSVSPSDDDSHVSFPSWCQEMNAFNTALSVEELFLLQMQRIAGVGKKTAESILEMGYKTIPQLEIALRDVSEEDGPLLLKKIAKEKGIARFNAKSSKSLYNLFAQNSYST